jgi:hypothetical protein
MMVSYHWLVTASHDIGTATLLAAGCYVFGLIPSSHPTQAGDAASRYLDVPTQLLDSESAISSKTTTSAGVPSCVLDGIEE